MNKNRKDQNIGEELQRELQRSINMTRRRATAADRERARRQLKSLSPKKLAALAAAIVVLLAGLWFLGGDPIDLVVYTLTGSHRYKGPAEGEARITVLASGMSDCTVIEAGEDIVMIDAGEFDSEDAILGFLADTGITEIDLLVITHPHTDHYGSAEDVLQACRVEEIMFTAVPDSMTPTASAYSRLLDTIAETKVPLRIAERGERIELDIGTLEVLWAGGEESADLNGTSIVLRYQLGNRAALFMGDAEFPVEEELLMSGDTLRADLLKAGHHGTRNATGSDFLAEVRPTYVAVTCESGNEYGFPKEDFMQRVEESGALLCRTDTEGHLVFLTDGVYFERSR